MVQSSRRMSNALRRRLSALQNLTTDRGAMPGEAAAASAAIERIRDRLRSAGEAVEWGDTTIANDDGWTHPGPPRRRARRKSSAERPARHRLHIGAIVDADYGDDPTWQRCRCGSSRFEVMEGQLPIAVAFLRCVQCTRSRKLSREDFLRGRHL
jgi:hypothetical protein